MQKMMTIERKLRIFIGVCALIIVLLFMLLRYLTAYELSKKTDEGYIYSKEIIYENAPIYRIYIHNEVESDGKMIKKSNSFSVSEEMYLMYSIGDWFDSQNPWNTSVEVNGVTRIESAN